MSSPTASGKPGGYQENYSLLRMPKVRNGIMEMFGVKRKTLGKFAWASSLCDTCCPGPQSEVVSNSGSQETESKSKSRGKYSVRSLQPPVRGRLSSLLVQGRENKNAVISSSQSLRQRWAQRWKKVAAAAAPSVLIFHSCAIFFFFSLGFWRVVHFCMQLLAF